MGTPIIELGYISTQNEMDIFISNKSGTAEVYLLPLYITGAEGFLFYPMTTSSNTPIFFKVGVKSDYVPG